MRSLRMGKTKIHFRFRSQSQKPEPESAQNELHQYFRINIFQSLSLSLAHADSRFNLPIFHKLIHREAIQAVRRITVRINLSFQ